MDRRKIVSIIVGILILSYAIFNTDFVKDFNKAKGSIKDVVNVSTTTKKIEVTGNLKITYLDVGQADSILIEHNNHNMLIDAGNNEDGQKLVKYFKDNGITNFDYVVATHAHEDHIGGMDDIISNFDIHKFYMSDAITTTKTFVDVLDALESKNMKFNTPKIDDEFKLDDALFTVLYVANEASDLNDTSIVLKLTYGKNSFLFTGDASSKVEKRILNDDIKADVLKLGHHGSSYSTTNEFLDKVNPTYGIISCGKNNIYKHPSNTTLDKLSKRNIKVYRTDESGSIIVNSDGNKINIETTSTDTNG